MKLQTSEKWVEVVLNVSNALKTYCDLILASTYIPIYVMQNSISKIEDWFEDIWGITKWRVGEHVHISNIVQAWTAVIVPAAVANS